MLVKKAELHALGQSPGVAVFRPRVTRVGDPDFPCGVAPPQTAPVLTCFLPP